MVDAVVSFAVEKLGDALIQETFFLLGVREQVAELRDELRRMQCFLKDADAKQQGDERVRNWVADIRNVAYDSEDVIDTFMLKMSATPKSPNSGGVRSLIKKKALMVKNLRHLYKVGKQIQVIQAKLKAISASTVTYGINNLADDKRSSHVAPLRNHYPHLQDEDVTGLEEYTKTLLTELLKDEERLCVISIVGVGGLGKTTLAKKVYKDDKVARHFDCHAWCSISQQLNMREVLSEIIKKLMNVNQTHQSSNDSLVEMLYKLLQDERYFIVVDDLWSPEDWNILKPAFPKGKRGSKILLTTRNREVAFQADPWSLQLEPEVLNEEDSWDLLCKKAFLKTTRNSYPAGLEKLGREMVRKCGGLPLAICALGGILSTKREDIKEWKYVHRDVASNINRGKDGGVMGILALSYNDLPVHLKPCFLYFSLFPEDYAIPRKRLIQLWISEGFIPHTKENVQLTLEEAGKRQYYAELIQRCMIQADKDHNPEKGKTCRMHDLMRDLCLLKGKELNFLGIYDHRIDGTTFNSSSDETSRRLRRYAINLNDHSIDGVDFHFNNSASALRTLLVLQAPFFGLPSFKYYNIKLLRVLHLGHAHLLQNEVEMVFQLIHLRYLEMGGLYSRKVPSSIGNLRNLQTLYGAVLLPDTAANLVQLRHLESVCNEIKFSENLHIENLINLQTLVGVQAGEWIRKGCFGKLSKLHKLSVINTSPSQADVLIHEISSLEDRYHENPIRVLEISSKDNFDNQIFDSLSCCHNLHRLMLEGRIDVLNLQKYPPNLSKLILIKSKLEKDPMETLQHLPHLKLLELDQAFEGEEMVCSTTGFPQLQVLNIEWIRKLKKWTIDQGGMPCLKELKLHELDQLSMLPEGLRYITTLKNLTISDMYTIRKRIVRDVGEDWCKVQHIPSLVLK